MARTMPAPSSAISTKSSNEDALKPPKKTYVRVMTDKRREQNRRAQKTYRENLKRKLETLQEQVDSTEGTTIGIAEKEGGNEEAAPRDHSTLISNPSSTSETEKPVPPANMVGFDILESAGDLPIYNTIGAVFQYPTASTPLPSPSPSSDTPFSNYPSPASHQLAWRMPTRPAGTVYTPPPTSSAAYMSGALTAISPSYALTKQKQLLSHHPRHPRHPRSPTQHPNTTIPLPSPHINHITLLAESNLAATLAVALSLGISQNAYLEDHPSQFPHCFDIWYITISTTSSPFLPSPYPDLESRFLVSRTQPTNNPYHRSGVSVLCKKFHAASWATVHGAEERAPEKIRAHMSRIKNPLRPRPVQMLHSHPCYLDCIVFPRFRERAVQASIDGTLDHVEFFLDLMHGGLVCWGASTPEGGRRRRRGKKSRGWAEQVPWSTRSWEARRWFVEKWKDLIGTEEEEEAEGGGDGVWANSRWWWSVRGEEESEDEYGEGEELDDEDDSEEAVLRRLYQGCDGSGEGAGRFDLKGVVYEPPS